MQRVPKLGNSRVPVPVTSRRMAPTSSPPRKATPYEVPSNRQRQLAPTVGPAALGGRIRAGSAFAGIGDTVAIGRVMYDGVFPIVQADECWIPAKADAIKLSIIPFGDIHVFIGETVDSDGNALVSNAVRTAYELDTSAGNQSESQELPQEESALDLENRSESQELPQKESALDLEKFKPTQSALENKVEDQCKTAWISQVLEKQRCHFVHFLAHNPASASSMENAGPDKSEEAGEDSILDHLSELAGDASPLSSEEYNKWCAEMEAAIAKDA